MSLIDSIFIAPFALYAIIYAFSVKESCNSDESIEI